MILPTKHVRADRALLGVGADVLQTLSRPMTVSMVWDAVRLRRSASASNPVVEYRWFILALDLLFVIGSIELERGLLRKSRT